MSDRDDRKRTLSWREVDQRREKSRSRGSDPVHKASSPAAINAQKSYRAALEKAFAAGTLDELAKTLTRSTVPPDLKPPREAPPRPPSGPVRADPPPEAPAASAPEPVAPQKNPERELKQKLLAKIREAEGKEPVSKACDAFFAKHPCLPDDYEILTKALAHKNADRVRTVLEQLTRMVEREKPRRARALAGQLRFLEDTHPDADIRACACEVRGRL